MCPSHPTYAQKDKSSAWRLSFLRRGYKKFGEKNSKTESVVPFPGVQVTGKLSLLALSLFGLHGAADMLPASPLWIRRKVFFFTAPSSPALHAFPQNNQSNPHFPTRHLCVCIYLHTLWWGIRKGRGGATRRWMWRLSVAAVKAPPPTVQAPPPLAPL